MIFLNPLEFGDEPLDRLTPPDFPHCALGIALQRAGCANTVYGSDIDAVLIKELSDTATFVVKKPYLRRDEHAVISQVSPQIDFKLQVNFCG